MKQIVYTFTWADIPVSMRLHRRSWTLWSRHQTQQTQILIDTNTNANTDTNTDPNQILMNTNADTNGEDTKCNTPKQLLFPNTLKRQSSVQNPIFVPKYLSRWKMHFSQILQLKLFAVSCSQKLCCKRYCSGWPQFCLLRICFCAFIPDAKSCAQNLCCKTHFSGRT